MSYDSAPAIAAAPVAEPSRQAGLDRLAAFAPKAGRDYAGNRNFDRGPGRHDDVSRLSPYLRTRLILETEVLAATLARHSQAAAEKFIQEVYWRAYFKGWLEQRPDVWRSYCEEVARLRDTFGGALKQHYQRAIAGETGVACFDAWARELVATGYLHNHARMWFASIWIFTLKLPWQLGADFFLRHLLDGDPASNTLSWRWVGGLHTRGKTYLARPGNIEQYTDGRFGAAELAARLANAAPALDDPHAHPLRPLPPADSTPSGGRIGLLVTEEDCAPESLFPDLAPAAILGLGLAGEDFAASRAKRVRDFRDGAVKDALARARATYGVDADFTVDETWTERLVAFAAAHRLDAIATGYAAVGPVADRLAEAADALKARGVGLHRVRRAYDEDAWPHAAKGFFAIKKKIPALLERLPDAQQSLFGAMR